MERVFAGRDHCNCFLHGDRDDEVIAAVENVEGKRKRVARARETAIECLDEGPLEHAYRSHGSEVLRIRICMV